MHEPVLRKLHADLAKVGESYVLLKFDAKPMAADWDLAEILPCASRAAAREIRAKFLDRNPHRVVELWGRDVNNVWSTIEPHGPSRIPSPGDIVSPAQVPLGMYVGDGMRIWQVRGLKAAGVPSAWEHLPCLVCYRDLGVPTPSKGQYINPGDIMVGFATAAMMFIGPRKRADAVAEETRRSIVEAKRAAAEARRKLDEASVSSPREH